MRPLYIYVAGPYTKGDVAVNVQQNILAGNAVAKMGHIPFIPLLTHFWHMIEPHTYEFWMEQDRQWLRKCDAILRMPGESKGADEEVSFMTTMLSRPVYYSLEGIPNV
jgi:hypothetical protein